MPSISKNRITLVEREIRYRIAMMYYKTGFLAEAAKEFDIIGDYKDAQQIINNDPVLKGEIEEQRLMNTYY